MMTTCRKYAPTYALLCMAVIAACKGMVTPAGKSLGAVSGRPGAGGGEKISRRAGERQAVSGIGAGGRMMGGRGGGQPPRWPDTFIMEYVISMPHFYLTQPGGLR